MKGRKPKPTALHALHGTTNVTRHRARDSEPVPETPIQEIAPDWMTDSQKAGWRYALENAPAGLLKAIDRGVLAIWVEAEDRHRRACIEQAKLDTENALPMLTKTGGKVDGKGNVVGATIIQSPYIGIINRAAQLMLKAAAELGFSPAARPRLAAGSGMQLDAPGLGAAAPTPRANFQTYLASRPGPVVH